MRSRKKTMITTPIMIQNSHEPYMPAPVSSVSNRGSHARSSPMSQSSPASPTIHVLMTTPVTSSTARITGVLASFSILTSSSQVWSHWANTPSNLPVWLTSSQPPTERATNLSSYAPSPQPVMRPVTMTLPLVSSCLICICDPPSKLADPVITAADAEINH